MSNNLKQAFDTLRKAMDKSSSAKARLTSQSTHAKDLADDGEPYVPVGLHGVLASTEKLLAVNRGLIPTDERDSLQYKKTFRTSDLMKERVRLDADKLKRQMVRKVAKTRNLNAIHPFYFDPYTEKHLIGNPLSSPLEEINPMQLVEQARRVTLMGPGGIGTSQAITEDMQCHSADTEVMTKKGWKFWPDVTDQDELACRVNGVLEFHNPKRLFSADYEGIMYGVKSRSVNFLVTPNHRFFTSSSARAAEWSWETAEEHHGKFRVYHGASKPYAGKDASDTFTLPEVDIVPGAGRIKGIPIMDMGDWCEFLGWFLAEGCASTCNNHKYVVTVSQCEEANPEKVSRISSLLARLGMGFKKYGVNFVTKSKILHTYLSKFGKSYEKYIPDFLFEVKPEYRRRFLEAYFLGDGNTLNGKSFRYSTSSERMVKDLDRLLISVGASTSLAKPWMSRKRNGDPSRLVYSVHESCCPIKEVKPVNHFKEEYSGKVYCAEVPGSLLFTRRGRGTPVWTGNSLNPSTFGFLSSLEGPESERIGIDSRFAMGSKIGSDGRIYQKFWDNRKGKYRYMNSEDLDGLVLGLPD